MPRFISSILFILASVSIISASNLTDQAEKAYQNESYQEAVDLYRQAIEKEGTSATLYYNLGNAEYRLGHTARAILAYERALRLDPTDSDTRTNLEFVNDRIVDKKGETGSFIYNTFVSFTNIFSSNGWAWIAILFFCFTLAGIVAYTLSEIVWLRKIGFFGGIASLLFTIFAIILAFKARSFSLDDKDAIITAETSILSTVPRPPVNHDEEAMLLHEGTKVRVLRSMKIDVDSVAQTWNEVEVDNKHRAWINSDDIEKIWPEK